MVFCRIQNLEVKGVARPRIRRLRHRERVQSCFKSGFPGRHGEEFANEASERAATFRPVTEEAPATSTQP